jgi:WD40 repeat protein
VAGAAFAFSPDGRRLLGVGTGGRALVWDVHRLGKPVVLDGRMANSVGTVPPCTQAVGCSPWSPDSRYITGVNPAFVATLWDAGSGAAQSLHRPAFGAAFMPDMRVLVLDQPKGATVVNPSSATTCSPDPMPALPTRERLGTKRCASLATSGPIDSVAFTSTGRTLILSGGHVLLSDAQGRPVGGTASEPGLKGDLEAATITPDGRQLAVGTRDAIQAYDARDGRWRSASQPPGDVTRLAFDRAGKRLLAVGSDRTVRVWDVANLGRHPQVLRHPGDVLDAEFSADQGLVLTAGADGSARLWDPTQEAALLELHIGPHGGARFSNDGHLIALGGTDAAGLSTCEICAPVGTLVRLARARLPDG